MQRLKGSEIIVAQRAIDKAFCAHDAVADDIVAYVLENINEPSIATDPKFTQPYRNMQQIVRSSWYRTANHGDSILEAARGFASSTEIERVQRLFDTWDPSPQQFIDKLKAKLAALRLMHATGDDHHPGDDPFPAATP